MPKKLNISYPSLREFLANHDVNNFSVLELRDLYTENWGTGEFENKSELRRWIYRHIKYLLERGVLVRSNDENEKPARYNKTESDGKSNREEVTENKPQKPPSPLEKLKAKQGQYQVDMLACQGECKEYEQIGVLRPSPRK